MESYSTIISLAVGNYVDDSDYSLNMSILIIFILLYLREC